MGSKWHDLGIELLDASQVEKLDTIEKENPSNYNKCCTSMFSLWLKTKSTASWNELIEALRQPNIGLSVLATKTEQMLMQLNPEG